MAINKKQLFSAGVVSAFALLVSAGLVAPVFAADNDNSQGLNGQGWGMRGGMRGGGMMGEGIVGTVSSINGTTLTVYGKQGLFNNTEASSTFTVDVANAKVRKGQEEGTVADIVVDDTVHIRGTVDGSNVTATNIFDGVMMRRDNDDDNDRPGPRSADEENAMANLVQGNGQPVVAGSVTAIDGSTLTITNKSNVTYTIDASDAKIVARGVAGSLSDISIDDEVVVQGAVNGTSVVASSVVDQQHKQTTGTTGSISSHMRGFFGGVGSFFKHLFGF